MKNFKIIPEPRKIFSAMLKDIKNAKKEILLETYIYTNDKIGREFRKELVKKAKQGVKVKVLIDAFGAGQLRNVTHRVLGYKEKDDSEVNFNFFKELIKFGGEVRFFKEIRYVFRMISANHERNHRKLLVVDNNIVHVGSANITEEGIDWRELSIRIEGDIAEHFTNSFNQHWNYTRFRKKIKSMIHKGFEIIQDIPGNLENITEDRYIDLIKNAKKEIFIEGPYFVPPLRIRKEFARAVKRGVSVKILLPYKADMKLMEIVRGRYLGSLYKKGVSLYYYTPGFLHSKLLIVDDRFFILGSSNLDYRSFRHQYEINLMGRDKAIILALKEFELSGLKKSKKFDYRHWVARSSFTKFLERLFYLIRRYL